MYRLLPHFIDTLVDAVEIFIFKFKLQTVLALMKSIQFIILSIGHQLILDRVFCYPL